MNGYKKILVAVDGSSLSIDAAEEGISLAQQLNAELAFIYVADSAVIFPTPDISGLTMVDTYTPVKILEEIRDEGTRVLAKLKMRTGITTETFLEDGKPSLEILNKALQVDADLIVIGTHGRTGLEHLLMGSVAEYVVRHSKCPVLVVPATTE